MRTLALFASVAVLLSACASRPAFHSESTVGRITARSDNDGGPSGPISQTVPIPVGGVIIPLAISSTKSTSPYYFYTILEASGRTIRTQSTKLFQINDCVGLWHPPQSRTSNPEYNFISGTLEESHDCN